MDEKQLKMKIIGVAIRQGDLVIALPKPNRHGDCIRYAVQVLGLTSNIIAGPAAHQGFYLEDGTYLDRILAGELLEINGQDLREEVVNGIVFSENLW